VKVGLQLYSVRTSFRADPLGTIDRIAELGYRYVEFFTHDAETWPGVGVDVPAAKLRDRMAAAGVTAVGAHVGPLDDRTIERAIAYHQELGNPAIGMSIDFWASRHEVIERCTRYDHYGAVCRKAGLQFYYHNHYHEFQAVDGEQIMDLIMANTDPELVKFELDAYWAVRGMVDPAELMRRHPGRFILIHQKDFPLLEVRHLDLWAKLDRSRLLDRATFESVVRPEEFIEIGDGILKVQDTIDAGSATGAGYILVEQDHGHGRSEFERVARSLSNLRRMRGLEWE
jgi:sugar phosphate isomerase/epimerase